jgi:hypothetical protein
MSHGTSKTRSLMSISFVLHDEVLSKRSMTTPEWRCNFRAIGPAFLPHETDTSRDCEAIGVGWPCRYRAS